MRKNIIQAVKAVGTFTTFLEALSRAGLEETLAGKGPLTVFAPADEAFASLPEGTVEALLAEPEKLSQIPTYHMVPGLLRADAAAELTTAPTVEGEELFLFVDDEVRVDGARLVSGDIDASNGLIHEIDRVLIPARME